MCRVSTQIAGKCLRPHLRTSFHHQPEAQHPISSAIHKLEGRLTHLLAQSGRSPRRSNSVAFGPKRTFGGCRDFPFIKGGQANFVSMLILLVGREGTSLARSSRWRRSRGGQRTRRAFSAPACASSIVSEFAHANARDERLEFAPDDVAREYPRQARGNIAPP